MSWLSAPEAGGSESGVLILAPLGYAYWSSHRTLRELAGRLAASGHQVLRFDYDATGDSAGGQWDAGRLEAWRESVAAAAGELRARGCTRLTLVGVRLGATLALLDAAALKADAVVAWAPVVSGRRYVREVRLLSVPVPAGAVPGADTDTRENLVAAGSALSAETMEALSSLDITRLERAPTARALVIDEVQTGVTERLRELGCEVEQVAWAGGETALEQPAEYATVPERILAGILDWVGVAPAVQVPGGPDRSTSAIVPWSQAAAVRERVVELTSARLVGIVSEPTDEVEPETTIVFLNSGSEPHIGPGRAWVEYARELATRGHRCLRVDFRGWGESPDDGHAPGRPYDEHCVQDAIEIVRALRAGGVVGGGGRIVLVGLCASAWVALRVVLKEPVEGVIALNPQLYWRPGDPVEATMAETRARRAPQRDREQRGQGLGLWSALDLLGARPWAAAWLDELSSASATTVLAFADGDDGIEYLRTRLSRRLRSAEATGRVKVVSIPEIDHSMHRSWLRPLVADLLDEQVRALPR
jgi:pimeloyl-ACP methyl ester carboxylesterase